MKFLMFQLLYVLLNEFPSSIVGSGEPIISEVHSNLNRQLHLLKLAKVLNGDLSYFSNDLHNIDTEVISSQSYDDATTRYGRGYDDLGLLHDLESNKYSVLNKIAENGKVEDLKLRSTYKTNKKSDTRNAIDVDTLQYWNISTPQVKMLRKRWNSKCDKKAVKTCRIACSDALSAMCREYKCKSKEKSKFKKECKKECKNKFNDDEGSSC